MMKAMVAGHICLDITPVFDGKLVGESDISLGSGKLYSVGTADVHTGGSVSNTGLAMRFFGADVTLLAKVGNDAFGKLVMAMLGDGRNMIKTEKAAGTSYSVVIAPPGIDRTFLHYSGTNDTFSSVDISKEDTADVGLVHFGYPTLMRSMYEQGGEQLSLLMKRLKDRGKLTSLDLSAVDPSSDAGKADWEGILSRTLPHVDFFLPSFEELCYMLDRKRYDELAGGGDMCSRICISDVRSLAGKAHALGAPFVLVKAGGAGMYYSCTAAPFARFLGLDGRGWEGKSGFQKSYKPSRVCSATGAGDTAIAAFLTSILKGKPLEDCVSLAAAAGATSVEAYDALGGLLTLPELENKINSGWETQNLIKE